MAARDRADALRYIRDRYDREESYMAVCNVAFGRPRVEPAEALRQVPDLILWTEEAKPELKPVWLDMLNGFSIDGFKRAGYWWAYRHIERGFTYEPETRLEDLA